MLSSAWFVIIITWCHHFAIITSTHMITAIVWIDCTKFIIVKFCHSIHFCWTEHSFKEDAYVNEIQQFFFNFRIFSRFFVRNVRATARNGFLWTNSFPLFRQSMNIYQLIVCIEIGNLFNKVIFECKDA